MRGQSHLTQQCMQIWMDFYLYNICVNFWYPDQNETWRYIHIDLYHVQQSTVNHCLPRKRKHLCLHLRLRLWMFKMASDVLFLIVFFHVVWWHFGSSLLVKFFRWLSGWETSPQSSDASEVSSRIMAWGTFTWIVFPKFCLHPTRHPNRKNIIIIIIIRFLFGFVGVFGQKTLKLLGRCS